MDTTIEYPLMSYSLKETKLMARSNRNTDEQEQQEQQEITTPVNSDNVTVEIFPVVEVSETEQTEQTETTEAPPANDYVEGRMLVKDGDDGRRRICISVKGKVVSDFYARETEEGIELSYPSAMFTYRGERVTESTLKKAGFSRTVKNVWYSPSTEDVRSR